MNKREHVINAVILGVGLGVVLTPEPTVDAPTADNVLRVGVPIVLGALVPDLDTAFGSHRKTFHNLLVLGLFAAFPLRFGNLHWVWVGILTHFVLDLLGGTRGMAFFYPYPEEYDVPVGVPVSSRWAMPVTLAVTGLELAVLAALAGSTVQIGSVRVSDMLPSLLGALGV
jgi:hypothetical protein